MKDLIIADGNIVIPSPYALTISEFKNLKVEELSAVYFFGDHRSPYGAYEEKDRWEQIKNILKAILKYNELSETSAVKLLKAARESVTKLERYFKEVDLTLMDDNGKPIFHAKDLISNLSNMAKVVQGLDDLEELVKKQQQKDNPNRGGVITNKYSQ